MNGGSQRPSSAAVAMTELRDAPRPEALIASLSQSLGGAVTVVFTMTDTDTFIDLSGHPVRPPTSPSVDITSGGELIAVLSGLGVERSILGADQPLDPTVVLLIANSALIARRRAEIERWYDARSDVVMALDGARTRLERDLHDGAQQLVLALLIELGLIVDECAGDVEARPAAERAKDEIANALDELRAIAHGIYPVSLDHGGLAAATAILGDQLKVRIDIDGADEMPPAVRMAVYRLIESAAEQASERAAKHITVTLTGDGGLMKVRITASDGNPLEPGTAADRIIALRGECQTDPQLEAVLPFNIGGLAPDPLPDRPTQLDGAYRQVVTHDDLRAVGFTETTTPNGRRGVSDTGEPLNLLVENSGFTNYWLEHGSYHWSQEQPGAIVGTSGSGYYVVDGDELVLANKLLAQDGRPIVMRFRWTRDVDGSVQLQPLDEWNLSRVFASAPWKPVDE